MDLEKKYIASAYDPLPVTMVKGKGVWLYDDRGNKYIDMLSAYSAVSHGHCHPRLLKVMKKQAKKVTLTSRTVYNETLGPFAEALCKLAGFDMMLPANGGVESVETAIKAARRWKGIDDPEIIVCSGNFHGRTTTVISFSDVEEYRRGFGPFTPGFKVIPFGDSQALEAAITEKTAAFLVEPIQGEGGIIIPPDGYLSAIREICDKNNVLLIFDEIQVGLGRTGKMFAFEHENVRPDCLILGKALSGGLYPVSAFLANKNVMDVFDPGSHGSTFGGNPLASAIAHEAIRILDEDNYAKRSETLGKYLLERLKTVEKAPYVVEVRGRGLFVGIELSIPARPICEGLLSDGVLVKDTHETVIRLAPPLMITKKELDTALDKVINRVLHL